jgi:hypothetical protein
MLIKPWVKNRVSASERRGRPGFSQKGDSHHMPILVANFAEEFNHGPHRLHGQRKNFEQESVFADLWSDVWSVVNKEAK